MSVVGQALSAAFVWAFLAAPFVLLLVAWRALR